MGEYMVVEFLTSIKDYKLSPKQKIFAQILKDKVSGYACCEKPNVDLMQFHRAHSLDSLNLWQISSGTKSQSNLLESVS